MDGILIFSHVRHIYSVLYGQLGIKQYTASSYWNHCTEAYNNESNFFSCVQWLELAILDLQRRTLTTNPPGTNPSQGCWNNLFLALFFSLFFPPTLFVVLTFFFFHFPSLFSSFFPSFFLHPFSCFFFFFLSSFTFDP